MEVINKDNPYLLYVGRDLGYPDTAMQVHAKNIAKIFKEIGYSIVFVSQRGWKPGMPEEIYDDGFRCIFAEKKAIPNDRLRKIYRIAI